MSGRFAWSTERGRLPAAAALVAGSFALALLLASAIPGVFRRWNDRLIDRFFILRYHLMGTSEISPHLVHVVVDDSTYSALGLPSWDRDAFGRALDLLQNAGVHLIACDVLFRDPAFPQTDRLLVAAAMKAQNIVLPLLLYPGEAGQDPEGTAEQYRFHPVVKKPGSPPVGGQVVAPFAALRAAAEGFGHIDCAPDPDGRIRRIPLLYRLGDGYVPALSLEAVLKFFDLGPQDLEVVFGKHLVLRGARLRDDVRKDIIIPIDGQGRIIVNFAGPYENTFQSFPVHKLLAAWPESETRSHLLDLLEGALVLLSDTSTAGKDYGPGIFGDVYPLSGLHLNIINSILTENLVADQGWLGTILATFLFAALLSVSAARFRMRGFVLCWALLYAVFLLFSFWLFSFRRIVPAVAAPTLGFVFALLAVSARGLLRGEREKFSRQAMLVAANRELAEKKRDLDMANERLFHLDQQSPAPPAEEPAEAPDRPLRSEALKNPEAFSEIVTNNEQMLAKFKYIETIAKNDNPVLITGESGVGKELIAKAIHKLSGRQGKFVPENIAGLDDTMVTDTLFGHAPGAYTDARIVRKGLVEEAAGGTLFLDEIGDMSVGSQVKLLRLMEEKEYRPLGVDEVRISDARIIIATNVDLEKRLEEGKFRQDLYYRLTHRIHIPPLRERLDDLPLLIDHFLERTAQAMGARKPVVPKELLPTLESYTFPGNIRELKNMLDNAWSRNKARPLSLAYLKEYIRNNSNKNLNQDVQLSFSGKFPTLQEVEQAVVAEALKRANRNQSSAARLLGLSPSALSRRLNHKREREVR